MSSPGLQWAAKWRCSTGHSLLLPVLVSPCRYYLITLRLVTRPLQYRTDGAPLSLLCRVPCFLFAYRAQVFVATHLANPVPTKSRPSLNTRRWPRYAIPMTYDSRHYGVRIFPHQLGDHGH